RARHFAYMSSRYAGEQTVNDVSLAVANAFLQVLFANELSQKSTANLQIAQGQVQRMQALFNAGAVPEGSLFELQALEAAEELNRITADNQRTLALLNLQQLLDLDQPIDVEIPSIELTPENMEPLPEPDAVFNVASEVYPAVLSAKYNVNAAEKGLAAAQGRRYPALSGFVNLSTSYSNAVKRIVSVDTTGTFIPIGIVSGTAIPVVTPEFAYQFENTPFGTQFEDNFGQAVGLSLSIPIFNGWAVNSGIRQSKLNLESNRIAFEQQRNFLLRDICTAHADASAAAKRYVAALQQEMSTQRAFLYAEQRFNAGTIASLDYDLSRRNLSAAQSDLLQAKYDYIFRLKILDYYQGKPLTLP
ncbi:MAG TPA: TolC family protein, partial [Chitinophagales bacterium]|nr:TolC family protein [Chitinophagales bacterium]